MAILHSCETHQHLEDHLTETYGSIHTGATTQRPSAALSGAFWGWIFPITAPSMHHRCTIDAPRGLDYLRIIVGMGADGING
jgi:hypothetical protein